MYVCACVGDVVCCIHVCICVCMCIGVYECVCMYVVCMCVVCVCVVCVYVCVCGVYVDMHVWVCVWCVYVSVYGVDPPSGSQSTISPVSLSSLAPCLPITPRVFLAYF